MSERVEQMFSQLRKGPWNADPMGVPQEGFGGNGNVESQGWLSDGSVTADVIQANAVIAGKIDADAVTAREIAANTITASEIAAGTITSNEIAANTITAGDIAANTITAAEIASNAITADEIAANTITAAEIAAGTITATEIAADAITTSELAANAVITENVLAANITSSRIELTISGKNFGANDGTGSAPGVFFDADSTMGVARLSGSLWLVSGSDGGLILGGGGTASIYDFFPLTDATHDLGTTATRWDVVYRVSESAVSDERKKRDIADAPLGLDFVRALRPRVFRWRDAVDTQEKERRRNALKPEQVAAAMKPWERRIATARAMQLRLDANDPRMEQLEAEIVEAREQIVAARSNIGEIPHRPGRRLHYGLIAQEVKAALDTMGVDSMDAGFWQEAPGGEQSLSYTELIAPLVLAVQELAARVEELEHDIP